jgi:hypothetical protein
VDIKRKVREKEETMEWEREREERNKEINILVVT